MRNAKRISVMLPVLLLCLTACSSQTEHHGQAEREETTDMAENDLVINEENVNLPTVLPGETTVQISKYVDENGDIAIIPKDFRVSEQEGEHTVHTGVVVIGTDKSKFVWVPTTQTKLAVRDFGSYFYGGSISDYWDETEQELYRDMVKSVERYGGFYMGRFEASCGGGEDVSDYVPASKRLAQPIRVFNRIWNQHPQCFIFIHLSTIFN